MQVDESPLIQEVASQLKGFPRHLGIHSGGFTLSSDPIIETVPIEPARMENRTIVQWDKEDLDIVGLLKVDLLSLGMLTAIRKTLDLVPPLTFATIPQDDRPTYAMIQKADTVGAFQIESRAQMSMLPRLRPANFYDLVIQVALVRPGPIQGGMVHPFLRRRRGVEPIDVPHPLLEPILRKTLGVPLFQEQVMKMAIVLADFTPGEADRLRRAIGAWRSSGEIGRLGQILMERLLKKGLPQEFVDRIFRQIQGFAEYGFPESHAASFALIAYASCYLKKHHPAEFLCGIINSQPMGFYSNHTLVEDARLHGAKVLPVHPQISDWDCTMEKGALRLGWRVASGMGEEVARAITEERKKRPFRSLPDFLIRTRIKPMTLQSLALADTFRCFGEEPRSALWKILAYANSFPRDADALSSGRIKQLSLFSERPESWPGDRDAARLDALTAIETIRSDHEAFGLSTRAHPMKVLRQESTHLPRHTSKSLRAQGKNGQPFSVAGMIVVRQKPPTANGMCFATLEDEFGFVDLVLFPPTLEKVESFFWDQSFFTVTGKIQIADDGFSFIVVSMKPLNF